MDKQGERAAASKKAHYEKNKEAIKARNREHNRKNRQIRKDWIKDYKESRPCTDCNQFFPFVCMDFDHLEEGDKEYLVSYLVNGVHSFEKIEKEIAKCDLVCANCHRIRTLQRNQSVPKAFRTSQVKINGDLPTS